MIIWIDAQLPPAIAVWINDNFPVDAIAVRDLKLRDANDEEIFQAAKQANSIVLTKDKDFVLLLDRFGVPPQIIWLTCGNTSNRTLRKILLATLNDTIVLLADGEELVQIS